MGFLGCIVSSQHEDDSSDGLIACNYRTSLFPTPTPKHGGEHSRGPVGLNAWAACIAKFSGVCDTYRRSSSVGVCGACFRSSGVPLRVYGLSGNSTCYSQWSAALDRWTLFRAGEMNGQAWSTHIVCDTWINLCMAFRCDLQVHFFEAPPAESGVPVVRFCFGVVTIMWNAKFMFVSYWIIPTCDGFSKSKPFRVARL